MTLDIMTYQPAGDKKSSDFFNEYRLKIYERRQIERIGRTCSTGYAGSSSRWSMAMP